MASDSEASCVSDPNFAVICSFLEKFGASCGITSPDFLELQEMLENTQELSQELIDIHIKLLRKVRRSVSADRWERVLIKLCHTYCTQDAWELERFGYKKARLSSKLRILKNLLEMQFDFNQKFKAEVNRLLASELRTEPIGRDKHGHSYWYQIDEHCQLRVYREDPDEETWALVANDREGLIRLISQLTSDDPNLADITLNDDSNSLEIEKPILDTGQTSSSTSNCEAEVDESSGGNENSKDVLSEPPSSETTATKVSVIEKSTLVVEKPKVAEKPTENTLKFKISTTSIIPHKPEEQPENLTAVGVKKENDFKLDENLKKPVGIDLSVPQTNSIQPQVKGVDLSNRKKKSINDLAANLRMKTHDMLYKNPVQEQEMDLSVKKPRMDPKQFSSLSVPPFEPISIESALRMSANFAESDEEIEDEEDEFDDEDEIELPSHMKQPRLSRPTLLGNSKKKTYSDEDEDEDEEEYGEEIEEPVMLIQGEGSGKDCENENINVNKSEDYSEAVEEPVMFFYGEGSGQECDTGNTGKEKEDTSSGKNSSELKDSSGSKLVQSNTLELIHTKEEDSKLKTLEDTGSASKSSSEVLEATDKQITEQCLEKTVVDCDSKDIKSELVVNESKHSASQENEQSPKCHKVGTVMIDVKSGDRGQTSDAVSLKKSSRWDIGKPIEGDSKRKIDDFTRKQQLCDDSTNSSIINNENSEIKLLNISKDETNNTISDINDTDVKTAVNKTSELQKLDESNRDSDKKDIELEKEDSLSVVSPSDTYGALIDQKTDEFQKPETGETDEIKKQPLFFFGPQCFQFKTPMAPYSPGVKGLNMKDSNMMLKRDELQKSNQENETCIERISSISDSVPTCINKSDILIDSAEQTTLLQTTSLSSEIKSMTDAKITVDVNKENTTENDSQDKTVKGKIFKNVEQIENVTEFKEKICIPKTEVKSPSIDNKVEAKENVDEIRKSDNNSSVVEVKQMEDVKNRVKETIEFENSIKVSSTSFINEIKIPEEGIEETTKENKQEKQIENNVTPVIENVASNKDSNKSIEEIKTNSDESANNTTDLISQKEQQKLVSDKQNIYSSEIQNSNDTVTKEMKSSTRLEEQGKLELESDMTQVTKALNANLSSSKKSQNLTDLMLITENKANVDSETNSSSDIAQDELSSSNIVTSVESCSTNLDKVTIVSIEKTQENIDTETNNIEKGSELLNSPKESDEIMDDKSETLSETLESLSTLIESKSDESDDQFKKSENDVENSNDGNLLITESKSNPTDKISTETDAKTSEENVSVISEKSEERTSKSVDNLEIIPADEKNSENDKRSAEGNVVISFQENVSVISIEEHSESVYNQGNYEKQLLVSKDDSLETVKKDNEDEIKDDLDINDSSTIKEHIEEKNPLTNEENILVSVIKGKSITSKEKIDTEVNQELENQVDQEAGSITVVSAENISATNPDKIEVEHHSSLDGEKLNTDELSIEKDLSAPKDKNNSIELISIDPQASSRTTKEAKIDIPIDVTFKTDVNILEELKPKLSPDEISTICEEDKIIETKTENKSIGNTEIKASETETTVDISLKTSKDAEFVNIEANKNSELSVLINQIQSDETKSAYIVDELTTKIDKNAESINIVESTSEIQNNKTKSETTLDEITIAKEDNNSESVNSNVTSIQSNETKSEKIVDELATIEDRNEISPSPVIVSDNRDPSYKTIVKLQTTKEIKSTESVIPVIKSVRSDQSDELPRSSNKNIDPVVEAKFDNPTTITREEDNIDVVDDIKSNSELQITTKAEEMKNVETEIESSESVEPVNEPVVDELTRDINKENKSLKEVNLEIENIDVKSESHFKIDECKPKLLNQSTVIVNITNTETTNSVPPEQINKIPSDKNEKNILQMEQVCIENIVNETIQKEKENETTILVTKSDQSVQDIIGDNPLENSCSLKNKIKVNVENESVTSNEPMIQEKEQESERPTHNVMSKKEKNKETQVSKKIEPEIIVTSVTTQKEFQIEKISPCKDEIVINKGNSNTNPDIIIDNAKHNCHIITEQLSNKSEKLEPNFKEDEKDKAENSQALENDKHSVEVNHLHIKADNQNENKSEIIEEHENPKLIEKIQDKKQCVKLINEVKESLNEKNTDSETTKKNNECKKIKSVEISTVKSAVSKEKNDEKKSDDITLKLDSGKLVQESKTTLRRQFIRKKTGIKKVDESTIEAEAKKEVKLAEEIQDKSHKDKVKEIKNKKAKANLKCDSVFDKVRDKNDFVAVSKNTRKYSLNIQNTKVTADVKQSDWNNEDSSDDNMMDSTACEQDNDYSGDSDSEEESKESDKIKESKPKVNHTDVKLQGTGSKIILKNINDLISYKNKLLDDKSDPLKSEVTSNKVEVATNDSVKDKLDQKSEIDIKLSKLVKSGAVNVIKLNKGTVDATSKNKSKTKPVESKLVDNKPPKLICVDITKLQEKSPSKPENKTIVELKQQSDISSTKSLESIGVDNEESNDVIDVPETDPLACSEEEILISKKNEEESTKSKRKGLSLTTFKLDDTEETDTSALIPEPIARALRNRKISIEAVNTSSRKRNNDVTVEGTGGKKRRGRGRKPANIGNRPEVSSKDVSSSDEENDTPLVVKVTTTQRGTGKARRGRGRGRGRGAVHVERIANDSPVLSSDPQSETSRPEVTPVPAEQKTPPGRKKRRVLGLDIDPAAIIQKTENDEPTTRSSVRQSRRIAQIKIKEEAERRKIEELTLIPDHKEHKKKKKKKDDDKDFKLDKKKTKYKEITEDEESEDEITEVINKTKHKKKRKHQDVRKLFNTSNPWQSSSESSTSNEEEEEEEVEEEPSDEEVAVVKSDHEFSPESDLESNVEIQPLRRARTVKKESDTEEPTDEHACQKCAKADHPEWILLCDKCDCGWHCSCLRPALLVIPEGDWFCPPCQHLTLIEALKSQLVEYDKKMNRREMEVRRKQRLAYVGISLDNVLPSKETEAAKDDDNNDRGQEMVSGDDSSESESGSDSGSSSGDESEPIYQLRERRQAHSYRFNDYDALINSAIQDELEAVKGAGNQGRGKDIATIVNAEKEEVQALLEQQQLQESEFERPPPVVPVYVEKPERGLASEESSDEGPRVVPKLSGRKKHRKLNSLDISSEDDAADDEDFKGTSASEEDDFEDLGSDDSDDLDGRRGKGRSGPTRRSTRARTTRYDREFINDDSEDEAPQRKKVRSIWDESESEESDKSWGKRKKSSKKQRHSLTPRTSKKSRKRKRRNDDSDPEVKSRPKKPKIKYGGLNDSDDEELLRRRTRGKKINYIDALGSDSEEDKKKSKPLESEDEYMANEDDEEAEEPLNPIEDEEKDTDSDSAQNILPAQRKIIKIIAPSKVLKGRGKAGIPRPQHLKPVTPPPPPVEPELMKETPEDVEDEEEEAEAPVPVDIPVIAANPDDLNEEEVGTMMMENEEYAKKQLELMAIQLAKEKKKREQEAKKLLEKKELPILPVIVVPAQPKKRGRKKKSEIEAIAAAAAAAAAAATAAAAEMPSTVPPITINPVVIQPPIQNPIIPLNQSEPMEKLTPQCPNMNLSPGEIPSTVPTVISDLTNSPPKRRGRGKGKKTLAAEAAANDPTSPSETVSAPTIIPPPTSVLSNTAPNSPILNTMSNVPVSAQNDPQNLSPNPAMQGGKLGIATPPQPFSQNQPTPSVITRMLQSQPISAQTFTSSANAMNQKYFPPGIPPEQQPPRGAPTGQFPPIAGRGRVPSPYRQSPPAMGMYPGVRPMTPNSPHRLRSPGPPNMQMFHSTHHSMDPSPSGGGPINIASNNRDRNSPGNVGSPMTSKEGPTPPPPPYSRAMTVNRFSPNENSPGPSLSHPIRHHMFPQATAHLQQPSPPPRPPPPGNFSPYHPPPPPNYHYGAYPPAPSLAAADDALPPTDYQGSPYPEHYNTADGTVHSSEGSNSKPFDEEGSGEFGGLVSYFSSQREDDLDT